MVLLQDLEVRIASSSTGQALDEYDPPEPVPSTDGFLTQKFIEATTGLRYQVEVYIKPSFELWDADGLTIGVCINGDIVRYQTFYPKATVKYRKNSGVPFIKDSVKCQEGSTCLDEDLEMEKEVLEKHANTFGCIEVYIERVKSIKLAKPRERSGKMFNPLLSSDTSKEMVKERHISHVMVSGEKRPVEDQGLVYTRERPYTMNNCRRFNFTFRYRSHMHLQLLGIYPKRQPSTQILQDVPEELIEEQNSASKIETERIRARESEVDEATETNKRPPFEKVYIDRIEVLENENRDLLQQNQRLSADIARITEVKDRMAALLQTLMGGNSSSVSALPTNTMPGSSTSTTSALSASAPSIKRERIKEEENGEESRRSSNLNLSKRLKTVDLTGD